MNVYYNDDLIGSCEESMRDALKIMQDHLISLHKNCDDYWRWVGLSDNKTMVDFGSHIDFFYVDCPSELLFRDDKTRNLPINKRKQPRRKNKTSL